VDKGKELPELQSSRSKRRDRLKKHVGRQFQ